MVVIIEHLHSCQITHAVDRSARPHSQLSLKASFQPWVIVVCLVKCEEV